MMRVVLLRLELWQTRTLRYRFLHCAAMSIYAARCFPPDARNEHVTPILPLVTAAASHAGCCFFFCRCWRNGVWRAVSHAVLWHDTRCAGAEFAYVATLSCGGSSSRRRVPYIAPLRNTARMAGGERTHGTCADIVRTKMWFSFQRAAFYLLYGAVGAACRICAQGLPGDLPTTEEAPTASSSVSLSVKPVESSSMSWLLGGDASACSGKQE
jgi:hypothetical protein